MSVAPSRVYAARLVGLPIFDPQGDQVGKVRDLVVTMRLEGVQPRVLGMVAEVFGRRSVFLPMTRVTTIDSSQVYTTGLLNMRRFEQRSTETLVIGQMLDRTVTVKSTGVTGTVYDVAMERSRTRDWVLSRVAIREPSKGFRRRGQTHVVEWDDVTGLARTDDRQGATHLVAAINDMRPADAASMLHDLPVERRTAVAMALDDERLADVLEELPEEDQVEILERLDSERAADVLEEMSADDAADLVADLPPETAEILLQPMEPEEAEDVRRLMKYVENTAGGDDDARAGDPRPRRHHRRRARARPQPRAHARAGGAGLRVPSAAGVPDRQAARHRAHPAAAARAAVDAGRGRPRRRARVAPSRGDHRRGRGAPGDVQPGRGARRRREPPPARRGDASTTSSTTCSRPTGASGPPAAGAPWLSPRRTADRLDTPQAVRRQLVRRPSYDTDTFGVFAERFARFMGTAKFLIWMTAGRPRLGAVERPRARRPARSTSIPFIFLTLVLSLQASYAAPLILLAQNRQEDRDRVIATQDREAATRAHADMEFLAREMASLRMAIGEVATRDYLRSELRALLAELEERDEGRRARGWGVSRRPRVTTRSRPLPRLVVMSTTHAVPTVEQVTAALATVNDPEIKRPITDLGMVDTVEVSTDDGVVSVRVLLTVAGCPLKDTINREVTAAVRALDGVTRVDLDLGVMTAEQRSGLQEQLRGGQAQREIPFAQPGSLTKVFAIASGKGGVGKSSVTVNLALALANAGPQGRHRRRRHLRPLGARDARRRGLPADPGRRHDHAGADRHRRLGDLDRHAEAEARPGRRLARTDARPGAGADARRRLLGRPRRTAARPAAGHRRHRDLAGPAPARAPRSSS